MHDYMQLALAGTQAIIAFCQVLIVLRINRDF